MDIVDFLTHELGRVPGRNPDARPTAERIIIESRRTVDIDPLLVLAVCYVESGYNPMAESAVGARGLMQLMPPTALEVATKTQYHHYRGPGDLFKPIVSITLGTRYLAEMYEKYENWPAALTAYNRGPGNTDKILARFEGKIPETVMDAYASLINTKYHDFGKRWPPSSPDPDHLV